jgi:hypothetical protein
MNLGLFHHQFPVYTENIETKTGHEAINIWGFINRTLTKPMHFQKAAYSGTSAGMEENSRTLQHQMATLPIFMD